MKTAPVVEKVTDDRKPISRKKKVSKDDEMLSIRSQISTVEEKKHVRTGAGGQKITETSTHRKYDPEKRKAMQENAKPVDLLEVLAKINERLEKIEEKVFQKK